MPVICKTCRLRNSIESRGPLPSGLASSGKTSTFHRTRPSRPVSTAASRSGNSATSAASIATCGTRVSVPRTRRLEGGGADDG